MDMEDDIDGGVIWGDTQELTQQIEAANLSAEDLRGQGKLICCLFSCMAILLYW